MRLKPKTVRRLKLLAVVTILVVGGAFSLFVVRRWQNTRNTERLRREGMSALAAGQYSKTLDQLGRYLHRGRTADAQAWLAYAQARAGLEESNFSHIREAILAYQQYLDLKPGDAAARMAMLKLCNQIGLFVEARDAAERLRPSDLAKAGPEHLEVLRQEGIALAASKAFGPPNGDRLDKIIDRLLEISPLDLQGHLLRLEVFGKTERKAQAREGAKKLLDAHPGDPVAQVISATSLLVEPTGDEFRLARQMLAQAVGLDAGAPAFVFPNGSFAAHVSDIFDRLQAFDLSLQTISKWHLQHLGVPKDEDELQLCRSLARRLWQSGDQRGMAQHFGDTLKNVSTADSEVLAFVAMDAQRSNRSAVPTILEQLKSRPDDFRAKTWAAVIPLADPTRAVDPKSDSEVLKAAVKDSSRREPVFLVMLGEALAALSRVDEARELWRDAAQLPASAGWPFPHMRTAEVLLSEGRAAEAAAAATEALRAAPDSPVMNAVWFEAQAACLQRGATGMPDPALVLDRLEKAVSQIEAAQPTPEIRAVWERLLPPRVLFLARTGGREQAIQIARAAINGQPPLSTISLQRLASISKGERLGVEAEVLNRAPLSGEGAAGVAFAKALELARAGKPDEGLGVLRAAAGPGDADASLAIARYMERTNHPGALRAWVTLGDEFKLDVGVQRACLSSPIATADPAFIERTIERYKSLSGREPTAEDAIVRTAKARVLLRGSPTSRDRDAAIALLAPVISTQPKLVEPRLVLAGALQMSDSARGIRPELARATSQLVEALILEPRSAPIALELARTLQKQAEFARSKDVLVGLAVDALAELESRLMAARMLIAQGETSPVAIQTLKDLDTQWGTGAPTELLSSLGFAYESQRQNDAAAEVYGRLIAHAAVNVDDLYAAAKFFQFRALPERVAAALARAGQIGPGVHDDLASRLAADRGDFAESQRLFESAVAVAPSNAGIWRAYVASLLARSEVGPAERCALRALQAVPGDQPLMLMLEQARLATATPDATPDLRPLITELSKNPALSGAADMIKAIDAAQHRGDLERREGILALAEVYSTVPMLQLYLAQRMAAIDAEGAASLANRAATLAPGDASVSRSVAQLFLELGRWRELRTVATAWRANDPGRTAEADVAIAQACLNLKDYPAGLAALKSWTASAAANPMLPQSLAILNMNTRLLMADGREGEARSFLSPLLSSSPQVRAAIWLRTAAEVSRTLESARSWIDQVRPLIPVDAMDEQLALAGAWSVLASRFPSDGKQLLAVAREHLRSLTQKGDSAPAWEALGVVCHRLEDYPPAQSAYERALAIDPRRSISLNNLASLLLDTQNDAAAALPLAKRAVEVSADPSSLDTLGSVQIAIADAARASGQPATDLYKAAAETYARRATILRRDAEAWARTAEAATHAGDLAVASAAWGKVIDIPGLLPPFAATAKNNLAMTILQQEPTKEQIDRARGLVNEAILVADEPGFRDTLGWIELQANRRQAAIAAFRSAMAVPAAQPRPKSASIGLATALATGTSEERKEAAELLRGIEAKDLDANLAAKFRRVQSIVDADKP